MDLRPYQQEAIRLTLEAIQKGSTNKLVWVMATGTGKTVAFSDFSKITIETRKKKVLILAHREELLKQAQKKVLQASPSLNVSIEQAENVSDHINGDVIIASVPTLGRTGSTRIQKFNPKDFGLIIVDEAHHASADSYRNIFKYFGVQKARIIPKGEEPTEEDLQDNDWNKDCVLLGVTATPSRSDNKGINEVFDDVVFEYNIIQAIKEGFLAPIHAKRIKTTTDISHVGKTAGDFNLGELGEAVNVDERNEMIVKAYKDHVPGKQALVFAVNIEHAIALTQTFLADGVNTTYVFGSTKEEAREQRLEAFNNKEINVMVNVGVFTEGVDIPSIDAVLLARPTSSGILYSQMLGRGTRLYPGKEYLMVIDFVDNTKRGRLQTVASLFGKPDAIDFQGFDIMGYQQQIDDLTELAPGLDLETINVTEIQALIEKAKYSVEEIDLLGTLRKALPLAAYSNLEWVKYNEDQYRLHIGTNKESGIKKTFVITETITEKFVVKEQAFDTIKKINLQAKEIGSYSDIQLAVQQADDYIKINYNDVLYLASSNARWRKDKPSEKQIGFIKKLRQDGKLNPVAYTDQKIGELTKGDASRAISSGLATKKGTYTTQGALF